MQLSYLFKPWSEAMTPEERYLWTATRRSLRQYPRDVRFRLSTALRGGMPPMPPPFLRYRVAGHYDIAKFHNSGRASRTSLETALNTTGQTLGDFRRILDFGAGCSRIMRWMDDLSQHATLCGTDIDAKAIAWSARHIPYATFTVNDGLPPLPFADAQFDLIYSHSVFTHLDETYQDAWLAELRRVVAPGGTLLLTVHGDHAWQGFYNSNPDHPAMKNHVDDYEARGCHFVPDDEWTGVFPAFYHSMFHKKSYVLERWAQHFTVVDYLDRGMLNFQDIVVLKA